MKKLLFILNDCMRGFTYERIAGLSQAIQRMDEPASLCIIRTDAYAAFAPEHNRGEYNLFRLPNYSDFDGIILDINSIFNADSDTYNESVLYAVKAAAASGKPVVSVANDIDCFYYAGIDNYAAIRSMIAHLHEERGRSDFWFAMGPSDNYEVQDRARGLTDYCREHGLPCDESRFHYGSFTVESGESALHELLERHGGKLPHAVICANDRIALGVCHAAQLAGYAIPGDFMVTGFDDDEASSSVSPSITTVDQLSWNLGEACVDIMQRVWRGEDVPRRVHTPTRPVPRESTGCVYAPGERKKRLIDFVNQTSNVSIFSYNLSAMQYQLPGCESIEEICRSLVQCLSVLSIKGLRLILDSALFDYSRMLRFREQNGVALDAADGLRTTGYSDAMELVFSWEAGKEPRFERRRVGSTLDIEAYAGARENYLLAPLHFMEYTAGYLCVWNCVELVAIRGVSAIVNALCVALRNFFDRRNLSYVNEVLSGISMKDGLTGLYNRLGYHDQAYPLFRDVTSRGGRLGILFIDMDGLKLVNDTFGHAKGDQAIQSVARAILRCAPEDAIPVRYGGDEFLVLAPVEGEDALKGMIEGISAALPEEAQAVGATDTFGISAGYIVTDPAEEKSLDEYVYQADALMYREKRSKKRGRME